MTKKTKKTKKANNVITLEEERQLKKLDELFDRQERLYKTIIEPLDVVLCQKVAALVEQNVSMLIADKVLPEEERRKYELRFYRVVALMCAKISWPAFGGELKGGDGNPDAAVANPLMYALFGDLK